MMVAPRCNTFGVTTGDPGTDQQTLTAAGYLGGKIMSLRTPAPNGTWGSATGLIAIIPCDADTMVPYATLLNGPGEFAGAIGPSGSKKAPVVRAFWQGNVNFEAYDISPVAVTYAVGKYLYCGSGVKAGLYTPVVPTGVGIAPVGICTHVPTSSEPWVGIASLL